MDFGESVLDDLYEFENFEDGRDIKMSEIEEGELVERISKTELGKNSSVIEEGELVEMISKTELGENSSVISKPKLQETRVGAENLVNKDSGSKNQKRSKNKKKKKNKKKNKGNKGTPGSTIFDMNRFVTDVCRRLREPKSYLVWNAVACLGVSALSDLIDEVEAIQARGGQKTTDGRRFRFGGGILWNILKVREPNAYKEIMTKGKEFEKQLKQTPRNPRIKQERKEFISQKTPGAMTDQILVNALDGSDRPSAMLHDSQEQSTSGPKRQSVYSRIRRPVAYDDLYDEEYPKDVP